MINRPAKKISFVGAGIISLMKVYYEYLDAKLRGEKIRITLYEKNKNLTDTTSANIKPSLTVDEITAVVPRGADMPNKLKIPFNQPGGIRIRDVNNVNESATSKTFSDSAKKYGEDEIGHQLRSEALLTMGKKSMEMWQELYDNADAELKYILEQANFNVCREPTGEDNKKLHNGYRIDLIYDIEQAKQRALAMQSVYQKLGYQQCQLLTPYEVKKLDPYLAEFCNDHAVLNENNEQVWRDDAVAIWRPGGCIDTRVFIPLFYDYLRKKMGTYVNEAGLTKDCLQLHLDRKVEELSFQDLNEEETIINGVRFAGEEKIKQNKHPYQESHYVACPGEAVGTLNSLNLAEPAYAGFAGVSLVLTIPLSPEKREQYALLNHCMEVHQEGVVLAWQARIVGEAINFGVAGTKAFYGDQRPSTNDEFALNRNLLQLNMMNDVLPDIISLALQRNTKGIKLTMQDLKELETNGIAKRWAGIRAVAFDGYPTYGHGYKIDNGPIQQEEERGLTNLYKLVKNLLVITHYGSGGVSFAPSAAFFSKAAMQQKQTDSRALEQEDVLRFADARRKI